MRDGVAISVTTIPNKMRNGNSLIDRISPPETVAVCIYREGVVWFEGDLSGGDEYEQ
jgi:hypothetical protein